MESTPAPRFHLPALLAAAALTPCVRPLPPDDHSRASVTSLAPPSDSAALSPTTAESEPAANPFTTTIRPILAKSCAPCHEPNGQMYAKLPFDKPEVIASHSSGVLRRLKGEDNETVKRWIATQEAAQAAR